MSKNQKPVLHNHDIGDKTESQLLDVLSDMIKNNWRKQIDGDSEALDTHFFQINGEKNFCGITVKANPTLKQPGNGLVIFKNKKFDRHPLPSSWEELIDDSFVQSMDFVKQRYEFSKSECKVRDIYPNLYSHDSPDRRTKFHSLAVNFLLTFEIARRIEPKGTYPVTKEEVKSAQGIVFNPANYTKKNTTTYPKMVS